MSEPHNAAQAILLPDGAPTLLNRIVTADVGFTGPVESGKADAELGATFEAMHGRLRMPVQIGTQPGELRARVGIHDKRSKGAAVAARAGGEPTPWVHYDIELRRLGQGDSVEAVDDDWGRLASVLDRLIGAHACDVRFQIELPSKAPVVFTLPVSLGGDVPGFSEVRGVQLVKADPEKPENALYSVILQLFGQSLFVNVSTVAEVQLDRLVLQRAWTQALGIARLAAPGFDQ